MQSGGIGEFDRWWKKADPATVLNVRNSINSGWLVCEHSTVEAPTVEQEIIFKQKSGIFVCLWILIVYCPSYFRNCEGWARVSASGFSCSLLVNIKGLRFYKVSFPVWLLSNSYLLRILDVSFVTFKSRSSLPSLINVPLYTRLHCRNYSQIVLLHSGNFRNFYFIGLKTIEIFAER